MRSGAGRSTPHGDRAKSPSCYYVYTISVSGVVRYIGKGKGLRLYSHMKEVRSRLRRDFRINNIGSRLQRNLTEAVLSGAKVVETIIVDNLTERAAYKLEYDQLREYVLAGRREQLWNVIPASIYTPRELKAFKERLQANLQSRDRWIRYLSGRTLAALTGRDEQNSGSWLQPNLKSGDDETVLTNARGMATAHGGQRHAQTLLRAMERLGLTSVQAAQINGRHGNRKSSEVCCGNGC